ncbi:MAG: hypothetical protein JW843_08040, partial [Candidatus Aminicenantes bacterium]|nr:hypothetical protein [Candidatus Aminicenantes bacterium]
GFGTAAVLAALFAAGTAAAAATTVEIRFGFGGWTLEPLRSTIETRSEEMIRDEFFKLLNSVLPSWVLTPVRTEIDSTSSGRSFHAEVWIPLGPGRFALGFRGDFFDFRIPFNASAFESIQVVGWPLAELSAQGAGTVTLKGLGISLLGRWAAVERRRFGLALRAGVAAFPFRGRIEMDQTLLAETLLGDVRLSGRLDETIAEIRTESGDMPSWMFAPVAGLEIAWRLDSRLSLFGCASVSHGTFYSAGISVSL